MRPFIVNKHNHQKLSICIVLFMLISTLGTPNGAIQKVNAAGAVYYVGGTGASDTNTGTSSQPFATIQKAATVAAAGDIVNIRTGTYRETITPTHSGTSGNPIIYQPDGAAVVKISGTDPADGGWSVYSGSIYQKNLSLPVTGYNNHMTSNTTLLANQVFIDGNMMTEARWPNLPNSDDLLDRSDFRDGTIGTWSGSGAMTLNDSGIPNIAGGWTGGTIWLNGWFISQTATITSHTGTQLQFPLSPDNAEFREYYYLTGRLGALDVEKEWFYDGTKLYMRAPGSISPNNVEAKKRNYAFDLSNKSYITIKNIDLFAATITTNTSSTNITLDGLKAKYINHSVTLPGPDLLYSHTDETGIRLMGANSIIRNSIVEYSSGQGIVLGAGNTATNNVVHDISYDGTYASGISPAPGTDGQSITYNSIYRTGRSSIDLLENLNVNIGYNDMYDYGMLNQDMGAVYSARQSDLTGTRVHHNWIHDSKALLTAEGIQTGIYYDQGAGPVITDHNVMWNNGSADLYVYHDDPSVFEFYNNTLETDTPTSYVTYQTTPLDIIKNNIFRGQLINVDPSTNSIHRTTDPKFVNSGNGGLAYRLQSTSPAINAGVAISGITDGYVGSAPDIGAYEYGGIDWIAGYVAPGGTPTPGDTLHIEAESYNTMSGVTNSGGIVGSTDGGDWVRYNGVDLSSGYTTLTSRYARDLAGTGSAEIRLDSTTGTLIGTLTTINTGGWATFTTGSTSLTGASGTHDVYIVFGTGTGNGNFDWFEFSGGGTPTPTPTIVNNTNSGITYSGSWFLSSNRGLGDYQNDVSAAMTNNDYVEYTFTGTGIEYIGEKNVDYGNYDIYIDNVFQQTVSAYNSGGRLVQQIIYSNKSLSSGTHTIKAVKKSATFMDLDAFKVYSI